MERKEKMGKKEMMRKRQRIAEEFKIVKAVLKNETIKVWMGQ